MQVGYVYKLSSLLTNNVYIGSTKLNIHDRLIRHRACFRRYNKRQGSYTTANMLLMYPDCVIESIETVHYNDISFLRERESFHILNNNNCVNKRNAVFNYDAYYLLNKDRLKQYYQDNKVKKLAYQKARYKRLHNPPIRIELIRDF